MFDSPFTSWLERLKISGRYYARGLYNEIASKNLFLWAQAIAFKVLVTIVPIVILATGLVGRVLQRSDAFAAVARFIHDFLPPSQGHQVVNFLHQLQSASGTIVGVGGVGLFLSAVSLFITLRIAVSNAFEQDWHEGRTVVGGYLFDVRMVLQVGLLFILTIGTSVFVQSIQGPTVLAFAGLDEPWVRESWQHAVQTLGLFVPFFITTAMFFQLYYFVPKPHPRKRAAVSGALVAGVLWEAAKQAFTYYATYIGHFDRYSNEGLGALGNTFGLITAFVFWVYFSGIVLMLGAVVASLREHRYVSAGLLPGQYREKKQKNGEAKSEGATAASKASEDGDTTEAEGVATKPAETQPAETQPAERQPAETQPAETQPAETQPAEPSPSVAESSSTERPTVQPAQTASSVEASSEENNSEPAPSTAPGRPRDEEAPPSPQDEPPSPQNQPPSPQGDGSPSGDGARDAGTPDSAQTVRNEN